MHKNIFKNLRKNSIYKFKKFVLINKKKLLQYELTDTQSIHICIKTFCFRNIFKPWNMKIRVLSRFLFDLEMKPCMHLKYQFWKNVTSEEWNSGTLNTFGHFLSSFLGVIATVFSNHAEKWRQKVSKSVQRPRVSLFRSDILSKLVL